MIPRQHFMCVTLSSSRRRLSNSFSSAVNSANAAVASGILRPSLKVFRKVRLRYVEWVRHIGEDNVSELIACILEVSFLYAKISSFLWRTLWIHLHKLVVSLVYKGNLK